jgi:transposase
VALVGEGRVVHRVLLGRPEGKRPLGDPDVHGRIILKLIFRKCYTYKILNKILNNQFKKTIYKL